MHIFIALISTLTHLNDCHLVSKLLTIINFNFYLLVVVLVKNIRLLFILDKLFETRYIIPLIEL